MSTLTYSVGSPTKSKCEYSPAPPLLFLSAGVESLRLFPHCARNSSSQPAPSLKEPISSKLTHVVIWPEDGDVVWCRQALLPVVEHLRVQAPHLRDV